MNSFFQSNEVKSSTHMEKEGLVRCIEYLQSRNVTIKSIVTDRHVQIVKWIRENLTETEHCFDVWHVAKGKVLQLAIRETYFINDLGLPLCQIQW